MEAARKKLDVNYIEGTSIAKEAYKLEREASMVAANQALIAGQESERGAASAAGRVVAMQNMAGATTRANMEGAIQDRELLVAQEDSRLAGLQSDIDLAEAEGAQAAAADAATASATAATQGIQGFTTAATTAANEFLPLYKAKSSTRFEDAKNISWDLANTDAFDAAGDATFKGAKGMKNLKEFERWWKKLTDGQKEMITTDSGYLGTNN